MLLTDKHPATVYAVFFVVWYLPLALTVPSTLQASGSGLLVILIALVCCRKQFVLAWKHTRPSWLLIAAAMLLGLLFSDLPDKSITGFYNAARAFMLFFAVFAIFSSLHATSLLQSATVINVTAATVISILFLVLTIAGNSLQFRNNMLLIQNIGNLHEFANLTAVCLLMLACLYAANTRKKTWLLLPLSLMLTVLIFTTSKGNWISVLLCMCYLLCRKNYRLAWYTVMILCLLIYTYIFFLYPADGYMPPTLENTIHIRQQIYTDTLRLVSDHPWSGHGINTFKYTSGLTDPTGVPYVMPHNIVLEQLYGWGAAGTLLFFLGLGLLVLTNGKTTSGDTTASAFLYLSGNTLLIYCLSRGLLDLKFFSFHYLGLLLFASALIIASRHFNQDLG